MPKLCSLFLLVATFATGPAHAAVVVNPQGVGQALIYPFYGVDDAWMNAFSVVNTTADAKALRVNIRESRIGQVVLTFNLYLGPQDVWTGLLYDPQGNNAGAGAFKTTEPSCTVPDLRSDAGLPVDAAGDRYAPLRIDQLFDNRELAPDFWDYVKETRAGYVEILELATITGSRRQQIIERDCAGLNASWAPFTGPWFSNPALDTAPPSGGLHGSVTYVNATRPQAAGSTAVALDNLFIAPLHNRPGSRAPALANGELPNATTRSQTIIDGKLATVDWERPLDAVHAVLAARSLHGEYDATLDAATEWVIAFPTRNVLASEDATIAPFQQPYVAGMACEFDWLGSAAATVTNADGLASPAIPNPPILVDPPPPVEPKPALCKAVNRIAIGADDVFGPMIDTAVSLSELTDLNEAPFIRGQLTLDLSSGGQATNLVDNPNAQAARYRGLPALGFQVTALDLPSVPYNITFARATQLRRQGDACIGPCPDL